MAGIPQSSRNVVAGPTDPCEDSIQGLSILVAGLQRECLLYIPYVFLQIQHMGARGSYLGPSPGGGL